jgi:hypothetical protein
MLNVNTLQKTLSRMELPELQDYAAAHKNDPYVVAMALSIANTKKEAKTAQQGIAGMQPQPKVVDQQISQMVPQAPASAMAAAQLPENVGIGQLPVPGTAYAEGGIVAFGDGGEIPRYQDQGYVRYPYGVTGAAQPNDMFSIPGMVVGQPFTTANNPDLAQRVAEIESLPANRFSRATKDQMIAQAKQQAGIAATQTPLTTPTQIGPGSPRLPDTTVVPAAKKQADAAALADTAALDKAAADKARDEKDALSRREQPVGLPALSGYEQKLESAINKNAPKKEDFLKEIADVDKPFLEAAQANIDKEAKRLSTDKETDLYMSMIVGGAKAAAGTSQYALQNIAEGLASGAANYKDALKDFRKATQENSKAELALKQYEATGKKDALKSYYDAQSRRDDRYAQGLTSLMAQEMQTKGQMAVASMPGQQERLFKSLADKDSAAYKGFENYASKMGAEAKGDTALRTAAVNKWSSEPMLRQEFNNDFDSYLRMMTGQQNLAGATTKQLELLKKYGT